MPSLKLLFTASVLFSLLGCGHFKTTPSEKTYSDNLNVKLSANEKSPRPLDLTSSPNPDDNTQLNSPPPPSETTPMGLTPEDEKNKINDEDQSYTASDQADDLINKLLNDDEENDSESNATSNPEVQSNLTFMKVTMHPMVKSWIRFFTTQDRARFIRFMTNGAKYRTDIERILVEEGVPAELFFVGLIESGYFLKAQSHASAVGPWQFIRATAKRYHLTVARGLDERKDIFKATRAAAQYFKDLYKIFGSWELALSAYNAGEFGIMRRIKRARTENFFTLATQGHLHPETANYVPKVMAVMYIYDHLEDFNLKEISSDNPFDKTVKIKLKHAYSVYNVAQYLKMTKDDLLNLNPEITGPYTPFLPQKSYELRVPEINWSLYGDSFKAALQQENNQKQNRWRNIAQDSASKKPFSSLASRKRSSNVVLKILKNKKGQLIQTNRPLYYQVQSGDHLQSIAELFKISFKSLQLHNRMKTSKIIPGQKLLIPNKTKTYYVVQRGENINAIARKFGVSTYFIKQLNQGLSTNEIYSGQKLVVITD